MARKTVSSRFGRWQRADVWDRILSAIQRQAEMERRIDWSLHIVDSTIVRAHQHAAGDRGAGPATEALGRCRGGYCTKIHHPCERGGKPMVIVLTGGEQPEQPVFPTLLERAVVKRTG